MSDVNYYCPDCLVEVTKDGKGLIFNQPLAMIKFDPDSQFVEWRCSRCKNKFVEVYRVETHQSNQIAQSEKIIKEEYPVFKVNKK